MATSAANHGRSSSLGAAIIGFLKPNGSDINRLRNEFKDDSPYSAADLVFGITDPTSSQRMGGNKISSGDRKGKVKDWFKGHNRDLVLGRLAHHSGPDRRQPRDGHSPEVPKRTTGLKDHLNPKKIIEKSSEWFKGGHKDTEKSQGAHIYHHSNQSTILARPRTSLSFMDTGATSQQMFQDKKFAREYNRRSMKHSEDYLGVRGANPRTGLWDSSDSSNGPSKVNEEEKLENRLRRAYWIASDHEWNSVVEPCLSPIPQSVVGTPVRGSMRSDRLVPMPSARNPSPYNNQRICHIDSQLNNGSEPLMSMLCGEFIDAKSTWPACSKSIQRKAVGSTPSRPQEHISSSTETVIHNKGSNNTAESIQPTTDHNIVAGVGHPSEQAKAEMYKQGRFPGKVRWAAQNLGLKVPRKPCPEPQQEPTMKHQDQKAFLDIQAYERISTALASLNEHLRRAELDWLQQFTSTTTITIGGMDGSIQLKRGGATRKGLRLKTNPVQGEGDLIRKEVQKYFTSGRIRLREEGAVVKGLRLKAIQQ
ncbi:hypothetical protein HYALB_00001240 [Hymenoscyphus albidus]|uniref:Uncharacterized protein n=1 Tax=Hymenoscyphus albidus TaxID=595503 RepID=A0A9N9LED3_9HELO|nr:hypothetical protein HYALB_00001240 [Hymenoscyphus albidus]